MRYLAEYIDPKTGTTRMGTETRIVREYASKYNMFRYMHYHLRHKHFPPGQYRVVEWPPAGSGEEEREVGFLYKRV
jgi:hypothetical protein